MSGYSSVDEIFHSVINETSSNEDTSSNVSFDSFESDSNHQKDLQDYYARSDRFSQYHHTTQPVDVSSSLSSLMKFTLEFIKDTEQLNVKY